MVSGESSVCDVTSIWGDLGGGRGYIGGMFQWNELVMVVVVAG